MTAANSTVATSPTPRAPTATGAFRNPALWLVVGIPLATVLASIVTVSLAFRGAEPELPSHFAREGGSLELDQRRAERAQQLGVRLQLSVSPSGDIVAGLATNQTDTPLPPVMTLRMTHVTRPEFDRELTLTLGEDGRFTARGAAVPAGDWLLQIESGQAWRVRGRAVLPATRVSLGE